MEQKKITIRSGQGKLRLRTKILRVLLYALLLLGFVPAAGQRASTFTVNFKNAPLEQVFQQIEKQSAYRVLYLKKVLEGSKPVNLKLTGVSLIALLDKCFLGQPVSYSIQDSSILVSEKAIQSESKTSHSDPLTIVHVSGIIRSASGPLPGASVSVKGTAGGVMTNAEGYYSIDADQGSTLIYSYIGFYPKEQKVAADFSGNLNVQLEQKQVALNAVDVVSNGYQTLPKERATGSFVQIGNDLINRSIGTNILDRLDGITSGLVFNKNVNISDNSNPSNITIRGRSTIYANPNPLIVVDNFPFNGTLSSINPNDIATITILKDAAAASIWGAFSGNGVIVITTKKGKYNQNPTVSFNSNVTVSEKPNLWYAPRLSSTNFIDVEQFLFNSGAYDYDITSSSHPVLSPIVEVLEKRRNNQISSNDSIRLINEYKGYDTRNDVSKYFYRASINQQYSINVNGGGTNNLYYIGAGFDKNLNTQKGNDFSRVNITASETYSFLNKKLQITNSINYSKNRSESNDGISLNSIYPYVRLKGDDGKSMSIPYQYRQSYIDTAGEGNLLDWTYRPIDELNLSKHVTDVTEYRINSQVKYQIYSDLDISIQYQFNESQSIQTSLFSKESYFARDQINKFTQYDQTDGTYSRIIPLGGIKDVSSNNIISQNFRGQINYTHNWNPDHGLSVLAGYEVRDINGNYSLSRVYGFDEIGTVALIDYVNFYKLFYTSETARIDPNLLQQGTTNRFRSYFANSAYTFKHKYILTGSIRKDQSNIFGVSTNQKGIPLWSLGASWEINKENFYHLPWLPYIRLRITNGYNGNVDNTLSSLITATVNSGNYYNVPYSVLSNPPNPKLTWEKVSTTNFGIDFEFNKVLSGSVEYYIKHGKDLIGESLIDPTVGVSTFKGNSANMSGRGVDIVLNTKNVNRGLKWTSTILFSYARDRVTKYLLKPSTIINALSSSINPIEGNPLYSIYSLPWGHLDENGNPTLLIDGKASTNYEDIFYSANLDNLHYNGPANPPVFGSIVNDFGWNNISLSFNITYKFGYYFRRQSISNNDLFAGKFAFPDNDYINRWQKSGDEKRTEIPSLIYPANGIRDAAYQYSSILVDKADHIRFHDIRLSYDFKRGLFPKQPFQNIQVYCYVSNIGVIWKANKYGIDPDYVPNSSLIYPNPRNYSLGIKIGL